MIVEDLTCLMRQVSHQTGTQIAEAIKMTTARRSGPATPKPRPATGRSTTPTCAAVSREESITAQRTTAEEQNASKKWDSETVTESRWMWSEYQRKWPPERTPRSKDPTIQVPGAGEGNRTLTPEVDERVDTACDRIAVLERDKISPAMRAIESQDPDRHLVGFEDRVKGRDRIKEKVFDKMKEFAEFSPEKALASISDTIRYTFEYREARYTQGVWADIGRLKEQGFELHKLWNAWSDDKYKGVQSENGSNRTPASGSKCSFTHALAMRRSN